MTFRNVLYAFSIVAAVSASMIVHESRLAAPAAFTRQGPAPGTNNITLRVALASNNVAGLQEKLLSISTPGNSDFRQWLTMDEVKSFVQPSPDTLAAFNSFAAANKLQPTVISPNGEWVSITLPVSRANTLFAADFQIFTHPAMPRSITRTLSVSLPIELVGHVDVLHPTTTFTEPSVRLAASPSRSGNRPVNASCDTSLASGVITPACLQDLYGIPTTPATESNNTLLVTGYQGEVANTTALSAFLTALRPDIPPSTTFTVLTAAGGPLSPPDGFGSEADLDIQYTMGIATGVPAQFLSVGGDDFPGALLETTTFLDGIASPPSVLTTSYGLAESTFGTTMATKICNGYMALGARGISVLTASGDAGVRGNHNNANATVCADNTFAPFFPASCPFVTAVGSTQGLAPEVATNFTGGGFSNFFPSPTYQSRAVGEFFRVGVPVGFNGTFNRTGRGYPDVAVQGWNFQIVSGGETQLDGGTSASTPTFAGIIALINDSLIAAGKPVLGFLNPFLYSTASSAFRDVTVGHNSGFRCSASSVAFDAEKGWDPLTGFGTPIFDKLLAAAMA
ncbi:subtilisin-like protein [Mycena vulgaris]|nr:subtilisin-like protein [Mycena vulgaris]